MALITIDRLNVAAAYVTDLDQAVAFYVEALGFEKARDMAPGVLLYCKGADLNLYVEGGRKPRQETPTGAYPHFNVCFNAKDGVKAALASFEKAGIPIVSKYGDFSSSFSGFHFMDPAGNILEIAGKP